MLEYLGGILALGVFAFLIFLLFVVVWFFVSAIGYYKMFQKAGEAGWKAFIPYYSDYIRFKISWKGTMYWFFLGALLLVQLLPNSENLFLNILVIACGIAFIVLAIMMNIRLARAFGKGAGWGILLFFFPFIASLILGFGSAEYIGSTALSESWS